MFSKWSTVNSQRPESIAPPEQKLSSTLQYDHLIHLPTFFVKEIQPVHEAAKIEFFTIHICNVVFLRIRLPKVDPKRTATILAVKRVDFDVLAGIGGFDFYAFDEDLRGGDQRVR